MRRSHRKTGQKQTSKVIKSVPIHLRPHRLLVAIQNSAIYCQVARACPVWPLRAEWSRKPGCTSARLFDPRCKLRSQFSIYVGPTCRDSIAKERRSDGLSCPAAGFRHTDRDHCWIITARFRAESRRLSSAQIRRAAIVLGQHHLLLVP